MKFRNLSLSFKIGIIMAFIPLITGVSDFFIFCKSGDNFGEGCGFLLVLITFPIFLVIQFISRIIFWPLYLITDAPILWHISFTSVAMIAYFFIGLLIGKIITRLLGYRIAK